jgi:coenzyme F420 hydrogenase subunit beta
VHAGLSALPQLGVRDRHHKFARERTDDEVWGIGDVLLGARHRRELVENGQDGGFVSALLIYALENDVIDAALVSGLEGDGSTWRAVPAWRAPREDVIETAKSRYTYSANLLAYPEAAEGGAERIAAGRDGLHGLGAGAMQSRKAGKLARRLSLTIGLMCSKTFDDSIFEELFEAKYGIKRADIVKMNIKGVFQIWTRDGASTRSR